MPTLNPALIGARLATRPITEAYLRKILPGVIPGATAYRLARLVAG